SEDFTGHVFAEPASLDAAELIPALAAAGVTALKLEGRQRSRSYVASVVKAFREAVDSFAAGRPIPSGKLQGLSEGQATTSGSYVKTWR
ncbi:MAG: U32 family peptidase, partial [Novosphingobium sp.]|nr:U32 family peptidase [Novosphingobium sp.]